MDNGFQILPDILDTDQASELVGEFTKFSGEGAAGIRGLLQRSPVVHGLANSPVLLALATRALPAPAFPVRAILFDKTPDTNWKVPWHQDLAVALAEKQDVDGFGPWSVKDGVPHAHAPVWLLERMITLRLHLDDCPAENGALRVLPGSHLHGKLNAAEIAEWRQRVAEVVCEVQAGGVVLMRPLLLHASSASTRPGHRRVLHLEYACDELPGGLRWAEGTKSRQGLLAQETFEQARRRDQRTCWDALHDSTPVLSRSIRGFSP